MSLLPKSPEFDPYLVAEVHDRIYRLFSSGRHPHDAATGGITAGDYRFALTKHSLSAMTYPLLQEIYDHRVVNNDNRAVVSYRPEQIEKLLVFLRSKMVLDDLIDS